MNNEKNFLSNEYKEIRQGIIFEDDHQQHKYENLIKIKEVAAELGVNPGLAYYDTEDEAKNLLACIKAQLKRPEESLEVETDNSNNQRLNAVTVNKSSTEKFSEPDKIVRADEKIEKVEKRTAADISEDLLRTVRFVRCDGRLFYYKDNCYRYAEATVVERLVAEKFYEDIKKHGKASIAKDVYRMIEISPFVKELENNTRYVSIEEGLYDFDSGTIIPHTPDVFCSYSLNISYERAQNKGYNRYLQYLYSLYCGYAGCEELVRRDLQILGWLLSPDPFSRKFLQIRGEAGTGKSRRVEFFKGFFQPEDTMTAAMENMDGRFGMSLFYGKRFVDCGDLEDDIMSPSIVAKIKRLTGGDEIVVEDKGKKAFKYKPHCKIVFCSNFPLKIKKDDNAFAERLLILPMNKQLSMEERVVDFFQQFEDERDGIAFAALNEYHNVKANHYGFAGEEYVGRALDTNTLIELSERNTESSVYEKFVFEYIEVTEDPNDYVISSVLGEKFIAFAEANDYIEYYDKTTAAISRAVKSVTKSKLVCSKKKMLENKPTNIITGLKFIKAE